MPEFDSRYHRVRVDDNDGIRTLKFEHNQQSSMLLDDPFATHIEYVGYLHAAIAVVPDATRMLLVGLGGGSVAKQFWRDYPEMHVDAVELDPEVAEIAHDLFELPRDERICVHVAEGRAFVELQATGTYDIILVDAFDDDRVPRPLLTEEFMRACHTHLAEEGAIAWNVIGAVYGPHSKPFRSFYKTLRNVWRNVWALPLGIADDAVDNTRNIVVLASDAPLSADELADRIVSRVDGRVRVPGFERIAEDLYSGSVRTGDVALLVDELRSTGRKKR
jgi:spermidine synthase